MSSHVTITTPAHTSANDAYTYEACTPTAAQKGIVTHMYTTSGYAL